MFILGHIGETAKKKGAKAMCKYSYLKNNKVCKIYVYNVVVTTAEGNRYISVDAETYKEAETYACNVVANIEPYLVSMGKISPVCTTRVEPHEHWKNYFC